MSEVSSKKNETGEKKMEMYPIRVGEVDWQRMTGEVETKWFGLYVDSELIREISNISNGRVCFDRKRNGLVEVISSGYIDAREIVEAGLKDFGKSSVWSGLYNLNDEYNVVDGVITETADLSAIDLNQFREQVKIAKQKEEKEQRKRKEEQELKKKIKEEKERLEEQGIKAESTALGYYVFVEHSPKSFVKATEIKTPNNYRDRLEALQNLTPIIVYKQFTDNLLKEKKDLQNTIRDLKTRIEGEEEEEEDC